MPVINEYHRPERIEEALKILSRENSRTKVLAGGTNLGSAEFEDVDAVVDLQALGLNQVSIGSDQIVLGAMVRINDIVQEQGIPPLLMKMAWRDGPNTVRNAGTVGGVIVEADWESELYAALLVHDAWVSIQDNDGTRQVSLQEFSPEAIDHGVVVSVGLVPGGATADERVARTPADSPIVAVVGRRYEADKIQLAFCGISEKPVVANLDQLAGMKPPSDFRGSSEYRQAMAGTLGQRVVDQLTTN